MNSFYLDQEMDALFHLGLPYCELIVRQGHRFLYHGARGSGGEGKRFFLYSASKVMTVTAAMQLVEKGQLQLDAPLSRYLPEYADAFILKDGKPCPPDTVMTPRHLFTMSAGLNYRLDTPYILEAAAQPGSGTRGIVKSFIKAPLDFSPGDRFQYSLCHDVLGALIEAISGRTLAQYMRENIFEPLGMRRTSFDYTQAELAPKYLFQNGVYKPDPLKNAYILAPGYYSGGAGVISDAKDLSLFADALSCKGLSENGYRVLKPETIDLMRTDQMPTVLKHNNFSCAAGEEFSYGLGVHTLTRRIASTKAPLGVFGWDGAAGAYLMCDPQNQLSIAFITHVHCWPQIRDVFHRPIRNAAYAALEG